MGESQGGHNLKLKYLILILAVLVVGLSVMPAHADTVIPVQNASFETFNPLTISCLGTGCAYNTGPIPGWSQTGVGGSWQPSSTFYPLPLPDGSIVAFSNGGTISQTISGVSLLPDSTYTLSVFVGHRLDNYPANFSIGLDAGGISLGTLTGNNGGFNKGTWVDEIFTFTTGATVTPGDLSIVLASDGTQIDFDNVQLSVASVPEPNSASLLFVGLGALTALALLKRR